MSRFPLSHEKPSRVYLLYRSKVVTLLYVKQRRVHKTWHQVFDIGYDYNTVSLSRAIDYCLNFNIQTNVLKIIQVF